MAVQRLCLENRLPEDEPPKSAPKPIIGVSIGGAILGRYGSLEKVRTAVATTPVDTDPDFIEDIADTRAKTKYEIDLLKLRVKGVEHDHQDQAANRKMRWDYSRWVFKYLVSYSLFVAFLLLLVGFTQNYFTLDDSVLKFLVGSTAVSSIGLVAAVVAGLFGPRK